MATAMADAVDPKEVDAHAQMVSARSGTVAIGMHMFWLTLAA